MRFHVCLIFLLYPLICMATEPAGAAAYKNPELLVSTGWLQANLQNNDLMVIDARPDGFSAGHIPGAIHLDSTKIRTPNGLRPIQDLEDLLRGAGIEATGTFVIYDDGRTSQGASGWVFWMLEYLGCRKVSVLNGGWHKWTGENRPVDTKDRKRRASAFTAVVNAGIRADLKQVSHASTSTDQVLIDVRGDAAYNGWPLDGVARGGHIPGALNIDYAWFYTHNHTLLSAADITSLLEIRNVTPDKHIVAYDAGDTRAGHLYFVLRLMGFPGCAVYDGGAAEWAAQTALPMDRLPRYETLVHAQWVKDLIDGRNPSGYTGKRFVILETQYKGFSTSQPGEVIKGESHIPGAIVVHPCYFENGNDTSKYYPQYTTPDDGNLLPDEKLRAALAALGITHDTTVVVCGSGKIIPMTSGRVGWSLMYAGVEDVRILNGGMTAWTAAGFPVVDTPAPWQPVAEFGGGDAVRTNYLATTAYVREIVNGSHPTSVLVDVRKKEEYVGQECPYPFFDKKGHIPGCIWNGDYWVLVDKNDDTWRSYTEIEQMWKKLGITPGVEPVFYCGTAWRSTVGFFHAWLMGYDRMRNYDNSFYGWSFTPENPIAMGTH